ncbi:2828_t:CDS:1, partial [Acaulospora colombiana]
VGIVGQDGDMVGQRAERDEVEISVDSSKVVHVHVPDLEKREDGISEWEEDSDRVGWQQGLAMSAR